MFKSNNEYFNPLKIPNYIAFISNISGNEEVRQSCPHKLDLTKDPYSTGHLIVKG